LPFKAVTASKLHLDVVAAAADRLHRPPAADSAVFNRLAM
jgi:hypothetical protein